MPLVQYTDTSIYWTKARVGGTARHLHTPRSTSLMQSAKPLRRCARYGPRIPTRRITSGSPAQIFNILEVDNHDAAVSKITGRKRGFQITGQTWEATW